tara:strand:- start:13114 stop:13323 length:210 start_codon:yes stop_codon:yes gene_type:complete
MENIIKIEIHISLIGRMIIQKFADSNFATAKFKGQYENFHFRTTAKNESDLKADTLLFVKKQVEKSQKK